MIEAGPDLSRVALYARYSSHLQNPKSIDDQLAECRRHIRNLGGAVVAEYTDAAISGSMASTRPGLQALRRDCRRRRFTAVCTEALDRISRDQADTAYILKEFDFAETPLVTIHEGPVGPLLAGFKGTMNAMFLRDLSAKTRRGQIGLIRQGRQPGRPPYGYRLANRIEGSRIVRGIREIDPGTASVVKRIYSLYLDGASARAICRQLDDEGVPPPHSSKGWSRRSLTGNHLSVGILTNPIYKGEFIYGVSETLIDPTTAKRVHRFKPRESWTIAEVPHLRIMDDPTWDAVQERVHSRSRPRKHPAGLPSLIRGAMPLTPLLRCSHCKGPVRTIARHRWTCKTSRSSGKCMASTFVLRDIDVLCARQLTSWIRRRKEWGHILQGAQNRIAETRAQLEAEMTDRTLRQRRLINAVETGADTPAMRERITELGQELADLKTELARCAAGSRLRPANPDIRPVLLDRARQIQSAIETGPAETRISATIELAELLDHVDMSPGPGPGKASLRIQPNVISLIRNAARAPAER